MLKHFLYTTLAVLFLFTGCAEEEFGPVLETGAASSFTEPAAGASFVITEETLADVMTTFSWSAADFGFPSGTIYELQADLPGGGFQDPVLLASGLTTTSVDLMNSRMNSFLIGAGATPGTPQEVLVRVLGRVGTAADNNVLISEPISIQVTPFEAEVEVEALSVPGNYQGWDPGSAPLIYSLEDNGIYDGYVYFSEDNTEFKLTNEPNWDNGDFGDNDADGSLDAGGSNLMLPGSAGYYRVQADINALTYSITPTDWGVIGNATPTGWDSDTDMVYDADNNVLTLNLELVTGDDTAIKFRANDSWDLNLGDDSLDGSLEYNGANIPITEAGNYTITLDLNGPTPEYTLTRN